MTDSADICRSLSVLSALSAAFETFSSGRRPLPYPLKQPCPRTYFKTMVSSFGSTGPPQTSKSFVEDTQRVAAPPHRGVARETITLVIDGVPQELEVVRQERYLGGTQAYWCCGQCSALRSHLYVVEGVLLCRACGKLTYRSRVLQRHKAVLRVAKLRKKLGAGPSLLSPTPPRHPRWRRARYNRLIRELAAQEAIVAQALGGIVRDLKRRKGRLHGPR
jgi:hypothetical protein